MLTTNVLRIGANRSPTCADRVIRSQAVGFYRFWRSDASFPSSSQPARAPCSRGRSRGAEQQPVMNAEQHDDVDLTTVSDTRVSFDMAGFGSLDVIT